MKTLGFKIIVLVIVLLISSNAFSDEVILNNGDRLSGEIVSKKDEILILKTSYAGEVKITWSEIEKVIADNPVHVVLNDERKVDGLIYVDQQNQQYLENTQGNMEPLSIKQIVAINPPVEPKFHNSGSMNFGVDIDRGNTDQDDYHVDADTEFRWPDDRITLAFEGDIEESDGRTTEQEAKFSSNYDHFINEKIYSTTGLLLEHDKFADLDLRTTLNSGIGYQILENSRTNLSIEASPAYLWENLDESEDEDYPIFLWRLQFDHYLFEKWKLQAFHMHRFLQILEDSSNYIFLSKSGFRIPLIENLQMTLQYNFDRDNEPAEGAEKNDRKTLVTLGYKW